MCLEYLNLNNITSWVTIFGVAFAVVIYFLWKHNYKAQKSHDFALEILKKVKQLQCEIELLGSVRLIYGLSKELENIRDKISITINPLYTDLRSDLFVTEYILIKHKQISIEFNAGFKEVVLKPIHTAFYHYNRMADHNDDSIKKSQLYEIFMHSDSDNYSKKSKLKMSMEIVDNVFYRDVESFFNKIYNQLEDNLLDHSKTEFKNAQELTKKNNTGFGGMDSQ